MNFVYLTVCVFLNLCVAEGLFWVLWFFVFVFFVLFFFLV